LRFYRELSHSRGEAETLNSMGDLSFECSFLAESRDRYNQALIIARAITALLEEARALEGIGNCHLREGRVDDAVTLLRQARAIYRRLNSPYARRIEATLRDHDPLIG
jgi:tetratricopeptide (TPR) repeat protein